MNILIKQFIRTSLFLPHIGPVVFNLLKYRDRHSFCHYNKAILYGQNGNNLISQLISGSSPFMLTRLGSVELRVIVFFLHHRVKKIKEWPEYLCIQVKDNAGFFPTDAESIDRLASFLLQCLQHADIMGVWFNMNEDLVCRNYCPNADLVELGCLEPFRFNPPWSAVLCGKKVLVLHPFAETIAHQYGENRKLLFADPSVLPEFDLITLKAVQSIAGSPVPFANWFDSLDHMCDQISLKDFDIALIGAGAYGLPLACHVKSLGKQAIHMGGVTQILFGVKGRRWETEYADTTAKLFNRHWVRPADSEVPFGHKKVENGCYW